MTDNLLTDNQLSENSRARRLQIAREYFSAHTDEIREAAVEEYGDSDQAIVRWFVERVKGDNTAAVEEDGWLFAFLDLHEAA